MIWHTVDFVCRETALHLKRDRLIAIATISTVAVLLLVLGAVVLFLLNLRLWTDRLAHEVQIFAYFESDFPREQAVKAPEEISAWPEVLSTEFVPKEEGWEWLKDRLASSSGLGDMENPLPDAVRVRAKDPRHVQALAARLEHLQGVKDVVPSAESTRREGSFTGRVVQAKRIVFWAGVVISVLVVVAGAFIIHNTIRLALHSRWREIYIMQLVGASRTTVASPFLLEGMLHGLLGAAIASCVLVPVHMYLRDLSARATPFLFLAPDRALLPFTLYLLLAGALLGVTGSVVSIRRYLRRKPEWEA
ncbi:MAG: hypothetical protein JSV79_10420 [Armatimonadota bacterium]|nr:MAG: hypothetical protein JSV79_10420 [Armatimonadota bacterium]